MWPIFPTNPNDPSNSDCQVLQSLRKIRYLINMKPAALQHELDRSKHFLFLAADKVRTQNYFKTIQINLICIIARVTHFQRLIVNSTEAIRNRTFPPNRSQSHYFEKIAKLKVLILILTAEISARVKILQNPRASSSYDWSYMQSKNKAS